MTELVGYVCFTAVVERAVALRMLAARPGPRPSDDRFWAGPHAVIGVRGHAAEPDSSRALASGRPARAGLVAALLGRCSAGPGTASFDDDAGLVLDACVRGADDLPGSLDGDYALAVWDDHREHLTLVRDALGTRPLYYYRTPDGVVFASSLDAVLNHPAVPARLTTDGVRQMLAGIAVPGDTPYAGVREVRAGHALRFSRDGDQERRHWRLDGSAGHPDDLATTVGQTRELLAQAVRRRTNGGTVASLLSGGLDSSTLAALYAQQARAAIATFAVDYPGYETGYQPHIARPAPDSPYVRDMAAHIGSRHTDVILEAAALTATDLWDTLVDLLEAPTILADVEPSMYSLYRRVRQAADAVLGGEGADELFGGFPWFHHPQWALAEDFPWTPTTDMVVQPLFGRAFTELDVPGFRAEQYRTAADEFVGDRRDTRPDTRMRLVVQLFLTRFLPEQLERAHRFGAAIGLDIRTPFCDRALVEYVFAAPWSMQTFDGREKSLLRAAAGDLLPGSVRERRKSGYPLTRDAGYDRALRTAVGKLHTDPDAPVRPLVDEDLVQALHADPMGPDAPRLSRNEMELALRLNAWLTKRNLRLPG
ncbi:asparagine synthetase B family protein [Amycolatopsis regifaucium]|nr:asparagine synthase-related protein [Amycolatopsis regifaucium]SFH71283.1 asparagine synthase (glutamine-hydrolysing) [Amycolatopsis regifaucium]